MIIGKYTSFLILAVFFTFSNVFAVDKLFIEDLDLICNNSTRELKVYNVTQYNQDDVDFCKEGETPTEDSCINHQNIGGKILLYDGPFKGFEKIYEKKLNKQGKFNITFGKSSDYLLEFIPEGNFEKIEKIIFVRYCAKRVKNENTQIKEEIVISQNLSLDNKTYANESKTNLSIKEDNLSKILENEIEDLQTLENLNSGENSSTKSVQKSKGIVLFFVVLIFVIFVGTIFFVWFEVSKKRKKRLENKNLSKVLRYIKKYRIKFKDLEIKKALLNSNVSQEEIDCAFDILEKEGDDFFDIGK